MGDELRAAFVAGGACWGVMCITRELGSPSFTEDDAAVVSRVASHVAEGLRASTLVSGGGEKETARDGPGVILLDSDLTVVAETPRRDVGSPTSVVRT